jgi:hypothetical protein
VRRRSVGSSRLARHPGIRELPQSRCCSRLRSLLNLLLPLLKFLQELLWRLDGLLPIWLRWLIVGRCRVVSLISLVSLVIGGIIG